MTQVFSSTSLCLLYLFRTLTTQPNPTQLILRGSKKLSSTLRSEKALAIWKHFYLWIVWGDIIQLLLVFSLKTFFVSSNYFSSIEKAVQSICPLFLQRVRTMSIWAVQTKYSTGTAMLPWIMCDLCRTVRKYVLSPVQVQCSPAVIFIVPLCGLHRAELLSLRAVLLCLNFEMKKSTDVLVPFARNNNNINM